MNEKVESRAFERLRADVSDIKRDLREVKHHIRGLEGATGGVRRDQASLRKDGAEQHGRHDRLAEWVERLERRLGRRVRESDGG